MFSDESLSRVKVAGILLTTGGVGCVGKPVDFEKPERLSDHVLTKL